VASIEQQLTSEAQRTERIADSVDRLSASLAHAPDAARREEALLSDIKALLEAGAASTRRVEEVLSQIPRIADAQRETMVSIGRQLDLLREGGDRGIDAMAEFRDAVSKLGEETGTATTVLKEMHADLVADDERLARLLEERTRRLTIIASLAVAVAAVATLVGFVALFH
jgi:hypothetical protein